MVIELVEIWTYVGNKKDKVWLIYAYHRATGKIVGYVWGKRDYKFITLYKIPQSPQFLF